LILTAGAGSTVIAAGADVAEHPPASVTVTVKLPEVFTVIDCDVAPFDHRYDEKPPGALSVTLWFPQNVVGPDAVTAGGDGGVLTVTTVGDDVAVQPDASVTVTVNVPDALTVIDCVVAPLDHKYDAPPVAVSVTLPGVQNVVGPDGVIVAVAGAIGTTWEPVKVPHECVTVRPSTAVPLAPAVNVIVSAVDEDVIVPPVMVHAYEAPLTSGVEAVFPVELGQTLDGAVIVAATAVIGMVVELVAELQPFVTVRPSRMFPDGPTVKLIEGVPCPLLIVPPLMVQA